ncbi:MAG TPA: hypothetical protein VMV57_15565 [Terracidiphilus sp.]|nr:hypothetical protein [Terracidiphilus sp.]
MDTFKTLEASLRGTIRPTHSESRIARRVFSDVHFSQECGMEPLDSRKVGKEGMQMQRAGSDG